MHSRMHARLYASAQGVTGARLKEAQTINGSLLTLGSVQTFVYSSIYITIRLFGLLVDIYGVSVPPRLVA